MQESRVNERRIEVAAALTLQLSHTIFVVSVCTRCEGEPSEGHAERHRPPEMN